MVLEFENKIDGKDEWLTPPYIFQDLGPFDLDPCAPVNRPWDIAKNHYTQEGLSLPWSGYVFCNPPYNQLKQWLEKSKSHKNTIVLAFARTETQFFFNHVWSDASALLFIKGRLRFYNVDGTLAKNPAGAPSVLIAYGEYAKNRLKKSTIEGKYIELSNIIS